MADISVNEYVRTDAGSLGIVQDKSKWKLENYKIEDGEYLVEIDNTELCVLGEDVITKHSFNLIDLIEIGDYVNGIEIIDIDTTSWLDLQEEIVLKGTEGKEFFDKQIKTIVTHEQFEAMEYEVREDD